MKKFVLALLAVVLVLGLCTVAMAEGTESARPENTEAPTCSHKDPATVIYKEYEPATCSKTGLKGLWCAGCEQFTGVDAGSAEAFIEIPKKAHTPTTTAPIEDKNSCTESGSTYYICSVCKAHYDETEVAPKGHTEQDVEYTELTCMQDATKTFYCPDCDETITVVLQKAAGVHTPVVVRDVKSTCEDAGFVLYECAYADKGCKWVETKVPATYDYQPKAHKLANGKTAYTITVKVEKANTCTEDGLKLVECELCGDVKEAVITAPGHKFTAWHIDEEATCTKDGFKSRDCTVCFDAISGKPYEEVAVIPAKGHNVVSATTKAPTCIAEGSKYGPCTNCNLVVTEVLPKVDHVWTEWTVVGNAKVHTCKVCNLIEAETVAPETPADPDDKPATGDDDDNNSEGTGSSTGSGSDASIPATGDNTSNVPYIMMVAAVAGLVVLVASKRKVNC